MRATAAAATPATAAQLALQTTQTQSQLPPADVRNRRVARCPAPHPGPCLSMT